MRWLLTILFALAVSAVSAQQPGAGTYFRGLSLADQNGRRVDLYTDVLKGHVVLIHSFFATCDGSCPLMAAKVASLQARFAGQLGRRLRFVSISVDPKNDTPRNLHSYANRLKAKPGWLFLTGTQQEVDAALKKLGQYVTSPDAHSNVMIVGNEPTGLWTKVFGLASTEAIGDVVERALNDKAVP